MFFSRRTTFHEEIVEFENCLCSLEGANFGTRPQGTTGAQKSWGPWVLHFYHVTSVLIQSQSDEWWRLHWCPESLGYILIVCARWAAVYHAALDRVGHVTYQHDRHKFTFGGLELIRVFVYNKTPLPLRLQNRSSSGTAKFLEHQHKG